MEGLRISASPVTRAAPMQCRDGKNALHRHRDSALASFKTLVKCSQTVHGIRTSWEHFRAMHAAKFDSAELRAWPHTWQQCSRQPLLSSLCPVPTPRTYLWTEATEVLFRVRHTAVHGSGRLSSHLAPHACHSQLPGYNSAVIPPGRFELHFQLPMLGRQPVGGHLGLLQFHVKFVSHVASKRRWLLCGLAVQPRGRPLGVLLLLFAFSLCPCHCTASLCSTGGGVLALGQQLGGVSYGMRAQGAPCRTLWRDLVAPCSNIHGGFVPRALAWWFDYGDRVVVQPETLTGRLL